MFHDNYYKGITAFNFDVRCNNNNCSSINFAGISPQNKIERALNCSNNALSNEWVQFFISEIVDIPALKPSIEGIVGVNSCVEIISQKVINTPTVTGFTRPGGIVVPGQDIPNSECTNLTGKKLIIEAVLKQKVIYTALDTVQSLHSASFNVPFSTFIVVDASTPLNACLSLSVFIEDVFTCQLSDRSVFKNTTIFIKASPIC